MSKTTPRFYLGEKVRMSGTAKKVRDTRRTEFKEDPLPFKYEYDGTKTELSIGIIVGSRTARSGTTDYDWEDGATFKPDIGSARRVWLVAFNLYRKPVMCFDHQLTSEES